MWKLVPTYRTNNAQFTFICFATPAVLGSVSSFVLNGYALWSLVACGIGLIGLSRDRGMLQLAIPIYLYGAAYLASFAANYVSSDTFRHLPLIFTFLLFPFLYSNWSVSDKEAISRALVLASMASCYAALAVAIYQFHNWGMRAEGGAGNAIVFATATCLASAVSLAGLFLLERKWTLPLIGAFACGALATVYSGARIGWAALFLSSMAVLCIHRGTVRQHASRRTVAMVLLAALVLATVGLAPALERVEALLDDWALLGAGRYDTSLGLRVALWDIGLERAMEKPFLGHGPQSTTRLIAEGLESGYGIGTVFTHFHNGFLTALVETGAIGMLSLGAIFVAAAMNAGLALRKSGDKSEAFGATMLVIAVITYLVFGMAGILVGHDILDAMLLAFLIVGTYLSSGRSAPTPRKLWESRAT